MTMQPRCLLMLMLLAVALWLPACGDDEASDPPAAKVPVWPDLPLRGYIVGRPATGGDIDDGNAAFTFLDALQPGMPPPTPLDVIIPQYAIHTDPDSGKVTRAVLVQAEEFAGEKVLGLRPINGDLDISAPMGEVQLLGTDRPADDK